MNLSRAIRKAREVKDLSLTKFAAEVGVSVSTAHAWENGTHSVRMDKLPAIAKVLGVSVEDLFA
ncbi:MAG: helix-turn-helix domain-containing protein [Myxococcota bacterium]|nr:helix-turn-helix domain-containing protein [Myxococcota bacterium]